MQRTYKDSEREQLLREADTLNQLRYVGELADAIVNARPKLTELGQDYLVLFLTKVNVIIGFVFDLIPARLLFICKLGGLIEVVSVFHQRYAEFAQALLAAIRAAFSTDEKKAFEPKVSTLDFHSSDSLFITTYSIFLNSNSTSLLAH